MERDKTPRHFRPNCVSVAFDPDGGEHPVYQLADVTDIEGNPAHHYWCGGRTWTGEKGPERLADLIWEHWYDSCPWDSTYERQERSFTERFEP